MWPHVGGIWQIELFKDVPHLYCKKIWFSCSNPWETKESILEQIKKYGDDNTVIAPMNTKISTIGAAIASWEEEKIQICYAQAIRYNYANYSTPGDTCYVFELPELFALQKNED